MEIDFLTWTKWGLPVALFSVAAAWAMLMMIFRPRHPENISQTIDTLRQQRQSLGRWGRDETVTLIVFALVVLLGITQPFWRFLLPAATFERISRFGVYEIGLLCALLLFIVPIADKVFGALPSLPAASTP